MMRRIAVLGAGAIGSVVGGMLTKAGHDVTLVDQWPEHVQAMKTIGLRLSGTCGEHVVPVRALHLHELQSVDATFDAVFLAVKSYDTDWAAQLAAQYLEPRDGVVVDFQNGINDERVAAIVGRERTLGCVIAISAGIYEAGHAIRTDTGVVGFYVGELDGRDTPRAQELARVLGAVAPTKVTTNSPGSPDSDPLSCGSSRDRGACRSSSAPRSSASAARTATRSSRSSAASTRSGSWTRPKAVASPRLRPTSPRRPSAAPAGGRPCCKTSSSDAAPRSIS